MMPDTPQGTRHALPDTGLFACSESAARVGTKLCYLVICRGATQLVRNWAETPARGDSSAISAMYRSDQKQQQDGKP